MDKVKLSAEEEQKIKENTDEFRKHLVDAFESLEKIKSDLENKVENAKKVTMDLKQGLDEKCADKI